MLTAFLSQLTQNRLPMSGEMALPCEGPQEPDSSRVPSNPEYMRRRARDRIGAFGPARREVPPKSAWGKCSVTERPGQRKYLCAGVPTAYIVSGCWELKRNFRIQLPSCALRESREEIFYAAFVCLRPCFILAIYCSHLFLTTNRRPPVRRFWRLFLPQHAVVESDSARIRWRLWLQPSQLGV